MAANNWMFLFHPVALLQILTTSTHSPWQHVPVECLIIVCKWYMYFQRIAPKNVLNDSNIGAVIVDSFI